jgi:uncharacterized protein with von Willebrand factor type A (vWA) domain
VSRRRIASDSAEGHLLRNLLLFGRLLRRLGLDVSHGRMTDLARALEHVEIGRRGDVYHAAHALLVHRREDMPLFDAAFEAFWRPPRTGATALDLRAMGERRRFRRPRFAADPTAPRASGGDPPRESEDRPPELLRPVLSHSAREVLRHKDFAELTAEELDEVRALVHHLGLHLGERLTRRARAGGGPRLDLRRTLRRSMRRGGEVLEWAYREPRSKPRPLVVLADISGSMERYTRLLLLFAYGLAASLPQAVESFVFGTRLTRVTRELAGRDPDGALAAASRRVPDWSGGTRIGEALRAFNFAWGRRVLGRGAVVLIISDGWDRGDPAALREEMARLQRSCHRLIWLNPLLGGADYEPLARGIQAALPFTDDFLPAHNLASLEELARRLETLGPERRARRPPAPDPWGARASGPASASVAPLA